MNSPETIAIHEFSTGIRPQQTADGGWVSLGFTGRYMNQTLPQIPEVVQRSIANREFAVTEGSSSDRPAIIGREVGSGAEAWSVMAVVTRGRDEKGRSLSVYRYFLCQGQRNLWKIIAWWESQGCPTFNPFDAKVINRPNSYVSPSQNNVNLPPELLDLPLDAPTPILLQLQPSDAQSIKGLTQLINILAIRKSNRKSNVTGQPVSWAFSVEALEQPRRFQVILSASLNAYQVLERAINSAPLALAPAAWDEEAIKSAIRSLVNSSQVKLEAVREIHRAIINDRIPSDYWHTLFDGQGVNTAISQKIYSPQMVRLATLRAMVIPETLIEFLGWLNFKGGTKKPDENQKLSLEFQSELINKQFPQERLTDGMKLILPKLLNKEISPEAVYWLLDRGSAWSFCRDRFIQDIENDLKVISDSKVVAGSVNIHQGITQSRSDSQAQNLKCGNEIWKLIVNHWNFINYEHLSLRKYKRHFQQYKPLAQLFRLTGNYPLSAYFYQVSDGVVSEKIFFQAFNLREYYCSYLGLNIKRKVSLSEKVVNAIQNQNFSSIILITPLLISIFLVGCLSIYLNILKPTHDTNTEDAAGGEDDLNFWGNLRNPFRASKTNISEIPADKKKEALSKFDTTIKTIDEIVKEVKQDRPDVNKDQVITQMMVILNIQDLNLNRPKELNSLNKEDREKLIQAIYSYQKNASTEIESEHLGFMEPKMQSADLLREEIKTNLGLSSPSYVPPN